MQLAELIGDVPAERVSVVYDYHVDADGPRAQLAREALHALPYRELLEFERLAELLGFPRDVDPLDHSVSPRGFRILSHIPRLPEQIARRVVTDMDGLDSIVRASQRDLETIPGVGSVRAREIREGLRRLQEHNLVDRYLQL
jgi:diadenylate cyclase